jgi:hypothetical protein
MKLILLICSAIFSHLLFANPYPYINQVGLDQYTNSIHNLDIISEHVTDENVGTEVIRIDVKWNLGSNKKETYTIEHITKEYSGTSALIQHTKKEDLLGSYKARIIDPLSGKVAYYQAIGTGSQFRKLTGTLSFRFPFFNKEMNLILEAENPISGKMEKVLTKTIEPSKARLIPQIETTQKIIKKADKLPKIIISIYSEGYTKKREHIFFKDAKKIIIALDKYDFPERDHFEYRAIFSASNKKLGRAQSFPQRIERDSFLGLYFPYWNKFGRWYHVVYPTVAKKYRDGIGQSAYDHPISLVDDRAYWGVGNFMELTAIPAKNSRFEYLLLHELGHYFGLNEEYEGGGVTELQFAPGIEEPWSQNITFLKDPAKLKWKNLMSRNVTVPTPYSEWRRNRSIGAYLGGYADSYSKTPSHKPGHSCIMESGKTFCSVCKHALKKRILMDLN